MAGLEDLFERNVRWANRMVEADAGYFDRLTHLQAPQYLWIGCADSRVPANQIVGLEPGELFVHRNVANLVVHTDLNCLSVMQYAIEVLKVRHVIVCGHYGCGGVISALEDSELGLIENWLRHIQDVRNKSRDELDAIGDPAKRADRLCELNVVDQVLNVCRTTIVREAWRSGQDLTVHGLIYRLNDGRLHDLGINISSPSEIDERRTGRKA